MSGDASPRENKKYEDFSFMLNTATPPHPHPPNLMYSLPPLKVLHPARFLITAFKCHTYTLTATLTFTQAFIRKRETEPAKGIEMHKRWNVSVPTVELSLGLALP